MEFVVSRQRLNVLRTGFLATSDSFHSPHGIRVFYSLLLTRLETLVEVSNRADVATARRGLCGVGSLLDHFMAGQTERSARVARLQGDPEKLANKAFYRAVMEMFRSIRHSTSRELFADKEEVVDRTPHISGVASHSDDGPSSQGTKRGPRKRQPKSAPKRKRSCKISATALLARDAPVVEVKCDEWIPGSAFWSFCGLGVVPDEARVNLTELMNYRVFVPLTKNNFARVCAAIEPKKRREYRRCQSNNYNGLTCKVGNLAQFSYGYDAKKTVTLDDGRVVPGRFWFQVGRSYIVPVASIQDADDRRFCIEKYGEDSDVFCFEFEETTSSRAAEAHIAAVLFQTPRALAASERKRIMVEENETPREIR